jgi:hypothetical protein
MAGRDSSKKISEKIFLAPPRGFLQQFTRTSPPLRQDPNPGGRAWDSQNGDALKFALNCARIARTRSQ